jgi:hypothetical protein
MKTVRLHYNAHCAASTRLAQRAKKLDWFDRVELSTATPRVGDPVPPGQIVTEDFRCGCFDRGVYAVRHLCMQIPAFFVFGLLLYLPAVRRWLARKQIACAVAAPALPDAA